MQTKRKSAQYNDGDKWEGIKYVAFDAPEEEGGFEDRMACVQRRLARLSPEGRRHVLLMENEQFDGVCLPAPPLPKMVTF